MTKEQIKEDFIRYLRESDDIKEKRNEAINISADKKISKSSIYNFNFRFFEYKIDRGDFPIHPSAELSGEFELEISTHKESLETRFVYIYNIYDYLSAQGVSNPRIEQKDLKEFECFINDEIVKLDKGTAKKISSNYKLDEKIIKEEFKKAFDLYKDTNYTKTKETLDEINKRNIEFEQLKDMLDKSDDISKIVKKYGTPIQKIVYYRDILVIYDGYLNEKMRKETKKALDSFETELWSINDQKLRKKAEDTNLNVLNSLKKIGTGKLIYSSRGSQIQTNF